MKIDYSTTCKLPKEEDNLVWSFYSDLLHINNIIADNISYDKQLELHWQDWHDEYSLERIDPCPDYYGTYTLRDKNGEIIGDHMTIDDLNNILFVLEEFLNHLYYEKREA